MKSCLFTRYLPANLLVMETRLSSKKQKPRVVQTKQQSNSEATHEISKEQQGECRQSEV